MFQVSVRVLYFVVENPDICEILSRVSYIHRRQGKNNRSLRFVKISQSEETIAEASYCKCYFNCVEDM